LIEAAEPNAGSSLELAWRRITRRHHPRPLVSLNVLTNGSNHKLCLVTTDTRMSVTTQEAKSAICSTDSAQGNPIMKE
jgi:hypothetical protein